MKIGILTYHRSHNFGALLQAIATKKVLSDFGHEVYYIDYWPDYHLAMYSRFSWKEFNRRGLKGKYHYVKDCICRFSCKKKTYENYKAFIKKYIEPYCLPLGSSFDLIVYGSDQIWRKQPWLETYNPVYFGVHNSPARIHISYAASMGVLPQENDIEDRQLLKELLGHMDQVSVREDDLLSLLKNLGFINTRLCLDPALLLTSNQWDAVFPSSDKEIVDCKEKYVLFVNYILGSFNEKSLRNFAKKNGYAFVKINGSILGKDTTDAIVGASPLMLLNLIRNASFVFTSSYHAMIFSILYRVPFYASFANNRGRAKSLLINLGLENLYLSHDADLNVEVPFINYNYVHEKLALMRKPSIDYLKHICTIPELVN